jgi:hypothetical protein
MGRPVCLPGDGAIPCGCPIVGQEHKYIKIVKTMAQVTCDS